MIPRAAVVGWPVAHSLSPLIFAAFAKAAGRPLRYRAVPLKPEDLGQAVRRAASRAWTGWSVTVPHKVAIMEHLDWVDDSARACGAVNVVQFAGGRAIGHNTDALGFAAALARAGVDPAGRNVLVFGAGGAARAVCAALRRAGVSELVLLNRTRSKAAHLAERFGARVGTDAARELACADLIVNASSLGLGGKGSPLPGKFKLRRGAVAYDLVYRPAQTPFLTAAKKAGARAVGGLDMLVFQAAAAWRIWFREELPEAAIAKAAAAAARALAPKRGRK